MISNQAFHEGSRIEGTPSSSIKVPDVDSIFPRIPYSPQHQRTNHVHHLVLPSTMFYAHAQQCTSSKQAQLTNVSSPPTPKEWSHMMLFLQPDSPASPASHRLVSKLRSYFVRTSYVYFIVTAFCRYLYEEGRESTATWQEYEELNSILPGKEKERKGSEESNCGDLLPPNCRIK